MFPVTALGADDSDRPHGRLAVASEPSRDDGAGGGIAPYLLARSSRPWVVSHDPLPRWPGRPPHPRGASEVDGYCAASAASSASALASTASSVAYSASSTAAIANSTASAA